MVGIFGMNGGWAAEKSNDYRLERWKVITAIWIMDSISVIYGGDNDDLVTIIMLS